MNSGRTCGEGSSSLESHQQSPLHVAQDIRSRVTSAGVEAFQDGCYLKGEGEEVLSAKSSIFPPNQASKLRSRKCSIYNLKYLGRIK